MKNRAMAYLFFIESLDNNKYLMNIRENLFVLSLA